MKWKENGQFENPPAGSHIARCIGVIDMGSQVHSWQGETWTSRDVKIVFELPSCLMEGKYKPEVKGKPFAVSDTFKQSMHTASKLRPFLESWRGRKFTKDEIAAYDPKKLLGVPCRLTLIENGDYINIDGICKLSPGETCPPQVNQSVYFSLEREEFDEAILAKFTEKMQDKIKASPEYIALFKPVDDGSDSDVAPAATGEADAPPF